MLTLLTITIFAAMGLAVVLAPPPEPLLLFPEPWPSWPRKYRERREQHTLEEANTLDWIEQVKDISERQIEARRRRTVVTTSAPPWLAAPTPPSVAAMMVPDRETSPEIQAARQLAPRHWPPNMTGAHQLVRAALDARPEDYSLPEWARNENEKPQPDVEDEPVPQPEGEPESESDWPPEPPRQPDLLPPEPTAWQPGDPDNTIVRGIKAITDADLAEYEASLAKYEDRE